MSHIFEDFAIKFVFEFKAGEGSGAVGDKVDVKFSFIANRDFKVYLAFLAIAGIVGSIEYGEFIWAGYISKKIMN